MKICAAVVTYGDRFHLLKQVLDYIQESEIHELVLVKNGCNNASSKKIDDYLSHFRKGFKVKEFDQNHGSAKGFKTALELCSKSESDYIFIMDDDNLPDPNCLDLLKSAYVENSKSSDKHQLVVIANRADRINFRESISYSDGDRILSPMNNFLGFHVKDIFRKLAERFLQPKEKNITHVNSLKVVAAPYSGMLFARALLDAHGFPNENYFLYQDDFEYTYELTKNNGAIYLIPEATIKDIEQSEYLEENKGIFFHSSLSGKANITYYIFRNMYFFNRKYRTNNLLIFVLNGLLFSILIIILAIINGKTKRIALLYKAIRDAQSGNLGLNAGFPLN